MWEAVTVGHSGADIHRDRRRGLYRKRTVDAGREVAALTWLRDQGLPAAEVLDHESDWLITREVVGRTAAEPWAPEQRMKVVDALADTSNALHAIPVTDCPFDRSLDVTAVEARSAVEADRVDLDDLDDERSDLTAPQLLAALEAELPRMRVRELPSVTHGDWCLPNVVLDPQTAAVVGLLDAGRLGIADRYQDLALMDRSMRWTRVKPQYGALHAQRYLARCGHEASDDDKLAFYRLLDEFF